MSTKTKLLSRPGVLIEAPTGRNMPLLTELQHVSRQRFYKDVTTYGVCRRRYSMNELAS